MKLMNEPEDSNVTQTLRDAGCDKATIERIMRCKSMGNEKEALGLLTMHRACLLCKIHEAQKPLDTLDYLIFKLKKKGCF